ncbi:MAG: diguanylate cyclase [Eubacteriales bacterium]|nr:diguanylate cyclase [Eubacteriales bacterium]
MALEVILVSILFTFSAALIALILFVLAKRKQTHGLMIMGLLFLVNLIYILGYALELVSAAEQGKMLFNHLQYFGLPLILPFWFLLSIQFMNRNIKWTVKKILPVFIIPAVTVILNLTHELNGLFYTSHEFTNWQGIDVLVFQKGIWYHIETVYNMLLSVATIIIYISVNIKARGIEKKQSFTLLVMSVIALFLSTSSLINQSTSYIDFVPILLSTAAILMFVTLFKYELFDLVPMAYSKLFDALDYPVMILTDAMTVVKVNSVARDVFGDEFGGRNYIPLSEIFSDDAECIAIMKQDQEFMLKKTVRLSDRYYSVKMTNLFSPDDNKHKDYGYLLVFADVTSHIHQVKDLEMAAAIDPLTGLYNRRYFYAMAELAINAVKKDEKSLSVIMLDIDHFKTINDLYGHQGGDHILKAVVGAIKSQLRENDIFARYGGEEFIVLLPVTDPNTAQSVAERICGAVRESVFDYDGHLIRLTISAGVSGAKPMADRRVDNLIFMADKALYEAKSTGRDRVCVRLE